ncbi:MAG: hypothetical protein GTO41_19910, partial [Burkholderiales bacterium]|nr:hypothetical protein [Burkholderiales bacterium]
MHRLLGRIQLFALLVTSIAQIGTACLAQSDETLLVQRGQYDSIRAKSILELQLFRRETTALDHATSQKLRLISLNPAVGAWFVLQVQSAKTGKLESFHIENANPAIFSLTLTAKPNAALTVQGNGSKIRCTPWRGEGPP